mmetsp:Transcript_20168/g.42472  ORF Transcript_20168/g.42472 Transcript_20168/m.42472 type:complete len:242 (-) Transcript_20168:548-1273(-)
MPQVQPPGPRRHRRLQLRAPCLGVRLVLGVWCGGPGCGRVGLRSSGRAHADPRPRLQPLERRRAHERAGQRQRGQRGQRGRRRRLGRPQRCQPRGRTIIHFLCPSWPARGRIRPALVQPLGAEGGGTAGAFWDRSGAVRHTEDGPPKLRQPVGPHSNRCRVQLGSASGLNGWLNGPSGPRGGCQRSARRPGSHQPGGRGAWGGRRCSDRRQRWWWRWWWWRWYCRRWRCGRGRGRGRGPRR